MIKEKDILEAWSFLRRHNHSLPDELLDFIKESSLKVLANEAELDQRIAKAVEQACREQREGLKAVRDLINESYGVAGLHQNSDIAPWSELEAGGRFEEWLLAFNEAESLSASSEGE